MKSRTAFSNQLAALRKKYASLVARRNRIDPQWHNGIYERHVDPVVTAAHVPIEWRYDLSPNTNPFLMESLDLLPAIPLRRAHRRRIFHAENCRPVMLVRWEMDYC